MANKTRLLIIDDEDVVLKSSVRVLRGDEYEIDTTDSGVDGLEMARGGKYDIVITDLMMPKLGGMEILKTLNKEQPDLTVIIFTGFATVETAREALTNGAFDYIPKPFTPDELRKVVRNAVESRRDKTGSKMLDLMSIVSHELKSPISVVHTTAETLYKGYFGNLDPEQQKTIATILRNCQYLEDIIRNYLDLSKMEIDDIESFQQRIHLVKDVVDPVLSIPEHSSNMKNMKIVTDFTADPEILGDPNLLKIVMTNLINNAIKYGKPDTEIKVSIEENDREYRLSVFNEGVGISEEDMRNKLFRRFSRLKQKGTEGVKGSGLGLYICKTIMEKHQGAIWAESEPGSWSKFIISLPR
ncbi:MAG TPA: hybrid sensor histidine kinase/response regulator, partial [Spirochaetes bacterium]|nr:hybrid sensor histidine kinase/response regulator [Spirochaetota bacterium]